MNLASPNSTSTALGAPMDLWGGVECTINRVGKCYVNQLERSGHLRRIDDLERFAEIGLRTLRIPLLWEQLSPASPDHVDWSWSDQCMAAVKALRLRPIVGLLHHGSGPRYTDLTDPSFPEKFARFAARIARRYPWVEDYTPINEPLTTARFSALYGHWYPHRTDDRMFIRVLLNQLRATVLAMDEIRAVNPEAKLVQTEDVGRTFSTPRMRSQAAFNNERRWLTWDLLIGRLRREGSLWNYLEACTNPRDLDFFREPRCRIDVLGINHYVTSDRYLDENVANYPPEMQGRNQMDTYADDAAVRSRIIPSGGFKTAIAEAHNRYGLPMALTEVHLGCTVDERIRWFQEAWQSAEIMRGRGADIRAVTAWALLGSFDWDSLVTRNEGYYEAGAFDLAAGYPRSTSFVDMLRVLARRQTFGGPSPLAVGWWNKRTRLRFVAEGKLAA